MSVGAVAGGAALGVDLVAFADIDLVDRDQLGGGDRILVPPGRAGADGVPA
jgi:hypothetical protein